MLKYIEGQTAEELHFNWTIAELREFAKELKIKNRSQLNKYQLAMTIEDKLAD